MKMEFEEHSSGKGGGGGRGGTLGVLVQVFIVGLGHSGLTDAAGHVSFELVPEGEYKRWISKPEYEGGV